MKNTKNIQAVIFDMDGVIFDTENLCMQLWLEVADRHGLKKDVRKPMYESIGTNLQATTEIFMRYFGNDFPFEQYKEEVRAATKFYINERGIPIKQGAGELLKYLKETGFRIGLASSTRYQTVETHLKRARLYEYFDVIIGGDMVEKSKPEPDIFLQCCKTLGIKPGEAFIIEDSYNGIRAAKSAGALPLMVPDMIPADEEMKQLSYKIFNNLDEVRLYISQLMDDNTDMEKIVIHRATENDVLAIAEMAILMWKDNTVECLVELFTEIIHNEENVIFLIFIENQIIGFAQCQMRHDYVEGTESSPVGYLEGIYIKADFRRQGFAKRLLEKCEEWAKKKGCLEFASDCELNNESSRAFHMRMGFKEANRIICFTKLLPTL